MPFLLARLNLLYLCVVCEHACSEPDKNYQMEDRRGTRTALSQQYHNKAGSLSKENSLHA